MIKNFDFNVIADSLPFFMEGTAGKFLFNFFSTNRRYFIWHLIGLDENI